MAHPCDTRPHYECTSAFHMQCNNERLRELLRQMRCLHWESSWNVAVHQVVRGPIRLYRKWRLYMLLPLLDKQTLVLSHSVARQNLFCVAGDTKSSILLGIVIEGTTKCAKHFETFLALTNAQIANSLHAVAAGYSFAKLRAGGTHIDRDDSVPSTQRMASDSRFVRKGDILVAHT